MVTNVLLTNEAPLDRTETVITGAIASTLFYNETNGYTIARLRNKFTVKGEWDAEDNLNHGEEYRFYGEWREDDHRYGAYFAFTHVETIGLARSRPGVIRYLMTQCDLSESRAARLFDRYGPDTLEILRTDSQRAVNDNVLLPETASRIATSLNNNLKFQAQRIELTQLFAGRGFARDLVRRCLTKWGRKAVEFVRRDPFKLLAAGLPSAGFKRCDQLYLDLGLPANKLRRQFFAAWNAVRNLDGDTWALQGTVATAAVRQFGEAARIQDVIRLGVRSKWFAAREGKLDAHRGLTLIAERGKAADERAVASQLAWLLDASSNGGAAIYWPSAADLLAGPLSEHQREQISPLLDKRLFVLAGTPGTGKTYCGAWLIRAAMGKGNVASDDIKVCAPTGKAAVRITEYLQRNGVNLTATTIHRLLGYDGEGFEHDRDQPISAKILVVDESSMISCDLMASLLDAVPKGCHVLFLGDPYQLPPVGHGAPLRDMLAATAIPRAVLADIKRNDGTIVRACAAIKDQKQFKSVEKIDIDAGENLRFIETADAETAAETLRTVVEGIQRNAKWNPVWDVQVLTPLNDRSPVSRSKLNAMLQQILNPLRPGEVEASNGFRVRDKIICLKNGQHTVAVPRLDFADYSPSDANAYETTTLDNAGGPTDSSAAKVYLANGDQGEVVALSNRHVIAKFFWPERLVRIPLGRGRTKVKSERVEGENGDASEDVVTDDGANSNAEKSGRATGAVSDFALAYAITVHKSQGSSYPVVIVMVDDAAGRVASRELHYTAISRAEKVCLMIGSRAACDRQCKVSSLQPRRTYLRELIEEALGVTTLGVTTTVSRSKAEAVKVIKVKSISVSIDEL